MKLLPDDLPLLDLTPRLRGPDHPVTEDGSWAEVIIGTLALAALAVIAVVLLFAL